MVDGYSYRKACRDLGKIKDSFIASAIEHAENRLAAHQNEPRNVIEALVVDGHDFDYISNQCRHLIIAGFEMTSALLDFAFALIEQHPEVFRKLRAEILSWFGTDLVPRQSLNFENMKNCKYMQYVVKRDSSPLSCRSEHSESRRSRYCLTSRWTSRWKLTYCCTQELNSATWNISRSSPQRYLGRKCQ